MFSLMHGLTQRQTIAYSQGIMGINIKMITTSLRAMLKPRAGGFKAAWSSQELIYLGDLTVTS